MCEFEPFNPFPVHQSTATEEYFDDSVSLHQSEASNFMDVEEQTHIEDSSVQSQVESLREKSTGSEFHNMTKQLVITMKQIMNRYIKDLGSTNTINNVIRRVWEKLIKKNHPRKQTLIAMFDSEVNEKILKKEGLIETEDQFNIEDFKLAMNELKQEILMRMKDSIIRSNLIDRRIMKKDVLLAYIQHFLHEQLQNGEMKARFGSNGASKIKKILNRCKRQEDFISDFLI